MPVPARDSRKFCAWAGPCEPQPMTPICLIPSNAFGSNAKRSLPPRTMRSSVSPRRITWVSKTLELQDHCIRDTSYVYRWFVNETGVFSEVSDQERSAFLLLSAQVGQIL